MPDPLPCLRCGSDSVVPDAILTTVYSAQPHQLLLPRPKTLKSMLTTGTYHASRVQVCGDCGFIELYAEKPAEVWDDHLTRVTER